MKNVLVINGADFSANAVEQISFEQSLPHLNEWVSGLGEATITNGAYFDNYDPREGFLYDVNSVIRGGNGDFFSERNIMKICAYIQNGVTNLIIGSYNKTTGEMTQLAEFALSNYTSSRITSMTDAINLINCDIYIPQNSYLFVKFSGVGVPIIADNSNNGQYAPSYAKIHGGSKIQTDGTLVTRANTSPLIDFYV